MTLRSLQPVEPDEGGAEVEGALAGDEEVGLDGVEVAEAATGDAVVVQDVSMEPGVAVRAYGSRVKGTARPNSDLEPVVFTTPAQRPQVSELKDALDESNIPFRVDLHVWDEIPERFHEIIRSEYLDLS